MGLFCVLDCENSNAWKVGDFGNMFSEKLLIDGDTWDVYPIARSNSIPDDVKDYDGIVITGSHFNCRDGPNLEWFEPLCCLIKYCYEKETPYLFGGCFGCQVIAYALGGEVDYNPSQQFLCKVENIVPVNHDAYLRYLGTALDCSCLKVIVSHRDCVTKLPPGSIKLASSSSCENEIFLVGKNEFKNIFCCQSHPEFDVDYCIWERIWPIAVIKNKRLSDEEIALYEPGFRSYDRSHGSDTLIELIKRFLHT